MQPIKINPELGSVKEKVFMGLELWQVGNLALGLAVSLATVILLPDIGIFKGLIAAVPALPFVFIAIKPVYGLKGLKLLTAAVRSLRNSRSLKYESEEWKRVNKKC